MSGKNCLSSSENIRNCPKNRYSMDFGVGPIEYMYVCTCVCVWYMDKLLKTKNIYGLNPLESESMNRILHK
jgi:hypothetical protein